MEIRTKVIAGQYWAYACPRCENGTMAWEKDKADSEPYLKCVLCGEEWHREKSFGKSKKKSAEKEVKLRSETKPEPEKGKIKDYKWKFSRS